MPSAPSPRQSVIDGLIPLTHRKALPAVKAASAAFKAFADGSASPQAIKRLAGVELAKHGGMLANSVPAILAALEAAAKRSVCMGDGPKASATVAAGASVASTLHKMALDAERWGIVCKVESALLAGKVEPADAIDSVRATGIRADHPWIATISRLIVNAPDSVPVEAGTY